MNDIPKGGFICIYAGQLLTDKGANDVSANKSAPSLADVLLFLLITTPHSPFLLIFSLCIFSRLKVFLLLTFVQSRGQRKLTDMSRVQPVT